MDTKRILVVEDEQIVSASLCKRLQTLGYEVPATATSGEEAVAKTEQFRPDLVLMDIRLEGNLDGIEAAKLIHQRFRLPIIFLTAYSNKEVLDRARLAEPYGYILKPFEDRELQAAVSMALHKHEMEQRLEAEQETLSQARKLEAIGQLAGGMAHEFNNLLTIIVGYSEILLATLHDPSEAREMATYINRAAGRAASLTQQLLAYSRKQMRHLRILDLGSVVRGSEQRLQQLIGSDITLMTVLAPQSCAVKADVNQLEQVLTHLAANARDSMPQGGRLTIESRPVQLTADFAPSDPTFHPGAYALLSVKDTGIGMDRATLARLFEPFFTTKRPGKGTGLGLATVYGIVKQNAGHIRVSSEPKHGTTFEIYLPMLETAGADMGTFPISADIPRGSETILLAEDEDGVRTLAGFVLERLGYKVLSASDGEAALQLCAAQSIPIDLLLTDVLMPRMDGRQLWEAFRLLYPQGRVLFLSGYPDDPVLHQKVAESKYAYLQKPFTISALARKIREVLETKGDNEVTR